jgi:hypothetical protein
MAKNEHDKINPVGKSEQQRCEVLPAQELQ